jgi:hypothetical protein
LQQWLLVPGLRRHDIEMPADRGRMLGRTQGLC